MLSAFYYSFTQYDLVSKPTFVGLSNYSSLLTNTEFIRAVGVTLRYTLYFSPICLIVSFFIASLLKGNFRGRDFFRVLFFAPTVLSTIGLATAWRIMLGRQGATHQCDFGFKHTLVSQLPICTVGNYHDVSLATDGVLHHDLPRGLAVDPCGVL